MIADKSPHLKWINENTHLLVRHGSHAYNTNIESSDEDFKGICTPSKEYFLGYINNFEQAELKDPDTVIYDLRKFFHLAADCNPNIIEVLHTDSSDHILVDSIGESILDNKYAFLSKKVKHTFSGYAMAQLKRIKLHKKWIMNPIKEPPTRESMGLPEYTLIPQDQLVAAQAEINKELDRFQFNFLENLEESSKIEIRTVMSEMLAELKITSEQHWMSAARKIGLNDNFIELMQKERQYTGAKREFDQYQNWKSNRNPKRFELEEKFGYDAKHAYHLVRLMRMCKEILTTGKVIVKRPDREELLAIRNGAWSYDELMDFSLKQEEEINKLYTVSNILPNSPNRKYLDKLCVELVEKSLSKYSWFNIKKILNKIIIND